jgi:hypothetical protein
VTDPVSHAWRGCTRNLSKDSRHQGCTSRCADSERSEHFAPRRAREPLLEQMILQR